MLTNLGFLGPGRIPCHKTEGEDLVYASTQAVVLLLGCAGLKN